MSDPAPRPTGWVLPVLLAVATAAALGFGFLYAARPNAGELGAIRVVVADEDGKAGNTIHVLVAEAPFVQKDTVSPGPAYSGAVNYPVPYSKSPNLKVTAGKRRYEIVTETESGFLWNALPLADDFTPEAKTAKGDDNILGQLLRTSLQGAKARGQLRPDLMFEDFTWEAKGLRARAGPDVPKTYEQTGKFTTLVGQEGEIFFPVPYASPPNVELTGSYKTATVVTACTEKSFKWKNVARDPFGNQGDMTWTAKGVVGAVEGK